MPTLIIPDTHDKIDTLKTIDGHKDLDVGWHRVYLGDWTDSFGDHEKERLAITHYLKDELERDDRTFLWGNHDWHYHQHGPRCSGYNTVTQKMWNDILPKDWHIKFKFHVTVNGWLLSHAGFNRSPSLWKESDMPKSIGSARGGNGPGGPLWLDWDHEFEGFKPDGSWQPQIVGHTHHYHPMVFNGSVCLDTHLKYVGLLEADGTLALMRL